MIAWQKLILSQYDHSPRIKALVEQYAKAFDTDTDLDTFRRKIFDIGDYDLGSQASELSTRGLEIWGTIVAAERTFATTSHIVEEYEHVLGQDDPSAACVTAFCLCRGTVGTTIPAGSKVSDGTRQYVSTKAYTIGSGGTVAIPFTYTGSSAVAVPAKNTVTTIVTAVTGWSSVNNPSMGSTSGLGNFDNLVTDYDANHGGTFAREVVLDDSLTLADYAYRRLILLKAFANISAATLPKLNEFFHKMLEPYMPSGGYARVVNDDTMQVKLVTNFELSEYLLSIIHDSGVVPLPAGVTLVTENASA